MPIFFAPASDSYGSTISLDVAEDIFKEVITDEVVTDA